ncbi:uncharacterized protein LOC106660318 [Trichogramma pretiosum]|uniref:uncharacterized protein LOC106660318 n=1 Tax=Trichogramma pretiosum TaxID=7493 RepID=UPI0006C9B8B0|nr:uncharacterized protein LOC106660318 [Trichogramma pretiosum]
MHCSSFLSYLVILVMTNIRSCPAMADELSVNEVLPLPFLRSKNSSSSNKGIVCPTEPLGGFGIFLAPKCESNADCQYLSQDHRCCQNSCRRAVKQSGYQPAHNELFGLRKKCPVHPFPEHLPIKRCSKDKDCEPNRICCPDKTDSKLYCRTTAPFWAQLPLSIPQSSDTLKTIIGFMQCQQPPSPALDLFSKPCNKTMDCIPNLCCQEGSKKVCRSSKSSVLKLAVQATARFIKG